MEGEHMTIHSNVLKNLTLGVVVVAIPLSYTFLLNNHLEEKWSKEIQNQQEVIELLQKENELNETLIKELKESQLTKEEIETMINNKVKESEQQTKKYTDDKVKQLQVKNNEKKGGDVKSVTDNNAPKQYIKKFKGNISFYTAGVKSTGKTPSHPAYGLTASGAYVQEGVTVAADTSIPFGTRIYISGIGYRTVQDRGGKIKGNHLDVFIQDRKEALRLGRQQRDVYIISYPNK